MSNFNEFFDNDFKIEFLRKMGFEVEEVEFECSQPAYHNDVDYWKVSVWGVFKDGEEYKKPTHYGSPGKYGWVDAVFSKTFREHIQKQILKSL